MASTKISDETSAAALTGDELLLGVQSAANVKITIDQIVDLILSGFPWKQSVVAATTSAGTLATSFANGQAIDGVTLTTGMRILVKDQAAPAENGIYVVNASGAPTRAPDCDVGSGLINASVAVSSGTVQADTQWMCTANGPVTLGTTGLPFLQLGMGGGGLTNFTESLSSASPNATVYAAQILTNVGSTNGDFVLTPKGTGALLRSLPDATATGGNKRGDRAVDLQGERDTAAQVASGAYSVIAGGYSNKATMDYSGVASGQQNQATALYSNVSGGYSNLASGERAHIGGGMANIASAYASAVLGGNANSNAGAVAVICGGQSNTISSLGAYGVILGGQSNTLDAPAATVIGRYAKTYGIAGVIAYGSYSHTSTGDSQKLSLLMQAKTTNATATVVTSDGSAAAATNQLTLQNNSSMVVTGQLVVRQTSTGDTATWTFAAAIKRGANAAATQMIAACTPVSVAASAGAAAWVFTVDANTTLGCLRLNITGEAAKNLAWVANVDAVQNIY